MTRVDGSVRGFALIAVLVALSILLALVGPFMAAMLNEADVSDHEHVQRIG